MLDHPTHGLWPLPPAWILVILEPVSVASNAFGPWVTGLWSTKPWQRLLKIEMSIPELSYFLKADPPQSSVPLHPQVPSGSLQDLSFLHLFT